MNDIGSNTKENDYGQVVFSDEVISTIAGVATQEVEGVASMSAGIVEKLGKKALERGIKVDVGEKETIVDIYINIKYGIPIQEIAVNVQENVKKQIETMTGLSVVEINVYVQAVDFDRFSSDTN